ncbi:MAG: hypothetical protein HQ558_00515 [Candidatus Omnitrophica bacterium]|nr:hypothetical protein [Candidatus Omnitrophota bacterium]
MRKKSGFFKTLSVIISILLVLNNITWAMPDIAQQLQASSTLRAPSTGVRASSGGTGDGTPAVAELKEDLADAQVPGHGMPIHMVNSVTDNGVWQAKRGKGTIVTTAKIEIDANATVVATLSAESAQALAQQAGTEEGQAAQAAASLFAAGMNRFVVDMGRDDDITMPYADGVFSKPRTEMEFEIVRDNDMLADMLPASQDLKDAANLLPAIDTDVAKVDVTLREGLELTIALSIYYSICIQRDLDTRSALNEVLDLYLQLKPEQKEAIRKTLRSARQVDSGDAFWYFLEKAVDNPFYAKEDFEIDIAKVSGLRTAQLRQRIADIERQEAGLEGQAGFRKTRADLASEKENLWRQVEWRDQCVSEMMRYSKIDLPYDTETVNTMLSTLYSDLTSGAPVNIDQREEDILAVLQATYDPEVEGANIWRMAKHCNQEGKEVVAGRLSRAFANQARLYSIAAYLTARKEIVPKALALREYIRENGIEELYNPVEKLVVVLQKMGDVSMMEAFGAIEDFNKAVDTLLSEKKEALTMEFSDTLQRERVSDGTRALQRRRQEVLQETFAELTAKGQELWAEIQLSPKKAATFVIFLQRLSTPSGSTLLARTNTLRDPHPIEEADLKDLKRRGADNIYASPGDGRYNGRNIHWTMFADDWWEAIPMFIMERVAVVTLPDGSTKKVTQTEVDQQGMHTFYRANAEYWAENKQIAEYTWFTSMARDILFNTEGGKYKEARQRIEEEAAGAGIRLTHAQLMERLDAAAPGFKEDVSALAIVIAFSAKNMTRQINDYKKAHKRSTRRDAIMAVVINAESQTDANLYQDALSQYREALGTTATVDALPDICKLVIQAQLTINDSEKDAMRAFQGKMLLDEIMEYWDWLPRSSPLQEVLTTESAGMTEGYPQTWTEQEMEYYNVIKWMNLGEEVSEKRAEYRSLLHEAGSLIIQRLRLEDDVTIARDALGKNRPGEAEAAVVSSNPTVERATGQLCVLIEDAIDNGSDRASAIAEIDSLYVDVAGFRQGAPTEPVLQAIKDVIFNNGEEVEKAINAHLAATGESTSNIKALVDAITSNEDWRLDYEGQLHVRVIEHLITQKSTTENQLLDRAQTYIWEHASIGLSTARREVIAEHGLGYLLANNGFTYTGDDLNLVAYSPSRVNLAHLEKQSDDTWAKISGAATWEARKKASKSHRMINKHPRMWSSPKAAEVFKTFENTTAVVNTAMGDVLALIIKAVGEGDGEIMAADMSDRGDRNIWEGGEGYGGYCVPKDGLFLAFVLCLEKPHVLRQIGVPPELISEVQRIVKTILLRRSEFDSEADWQVWAAQELLNAHEGFGDFVHLTENHRGQKILALNLARIATVYGSALGREDIDIDNPRRAAFVPLARKGAEALIVALEQQSRLMPFVKAHMLLRQLADNGAESVNLTAEYKEAEAGRAVRDMRFSTGLREFEILSGICDHLIRQLSPELQIEAALLRFGFDLDSSNEMVRDASITKMKEDYGLWISEEECKGLRLGEQIALVKARFALQIEKAQAAHPRFNTPRQIKVTSSTGLSLANIFNYTDDRLVTMEEIADTAQRVIQDATGISDKVIAANSTEYGGDIFAWQGLRDAILEKNQGDVEKTEREYDALLHSTISVRGGGEEFEYPLTSAVHYLALKQALPGRFYEEDVQGCSVINLGVVPDSLKEIALDQPKLLTFMLAANSEAEPSISDGPAKRSGGAQRAYRTRDVMDFFAACGNIGKHGNYDAITLGDNEIPRIRERAEYEQSRADSLLEKVLAVAEAGDSAEALSQLHDEYYRLFMDIVDNEEALAALQDEKDLKNPHPRQSQQYRVIAEALVKINSGLPLGHLDFGTWLALGGMYVVIGMPAQDIRKLKESFDKAIAIVAQSTAGAAQVEVYYGEPFTPDEVETTVKTLAKPAYVPDPRKFGQEQMVEVSAKSIQERAKERMARRGAQRRAALKATTDKRTNDAYQATSRDLSNADTAYPDPFERLGFFCETADQYRGRLVRSARGILREADPETRVRQNSDHNPFTLYGNMLAASKAYVRELAGQLITPASPEEEQLLAKVLNDIDTVFTPEGFNAEEVKRLLGGYEHPRATLQVLAEYARGGAEEGDIDWQAFDLKNLNAYPSGTERNTEEDMQRVLIAVSLVYTCFSMSQTLESAIFLPQHLDQVQVWNDLTMYFAETIDDHRYWYKPWALARGKAFADMPMERIYECAHFIHGELYDYLRELIIYRTDCRDMDTKERDLLIGALRQGSEELDPNDIQNDRPDPEHPEVEAIGAYAGRADAPYSERFWRAFGQLRETSFMMNDGYEEMPLLRLDPDINFEENTAYPIPVVLNDFDPNIIKASERVTEVMLFSTARTHQRGLLRTGPGLNEARQSQGKCGANVIITKDAELRKVDGAEHPVITVKAGHTFLSEEEFITARRMQGYSPEAAALEVELFKKQGRFVNGRIRCAIKTREGTEIIAGAVVPFHGLPKFETRALESAKIPATCQSLFTWFITYEKAIYARVIEYARETTGTDLKLPPEISWDHKLTVELGNDPEAFKRVVADGNNDFMGLRAFAKQHPIIILKGARESGARNLRAMNMLDESGEVSEAKLAEAAEFIRDVSEEHGGQNIVIQKAVWIDPRYWASDEQMTEYVRRSITERGKAIKRGRYPQTSIYCSLRTVPTSASPNVKPDVVEFLDAFNTELATNVGRGGSLFALLPEYMRDDVREVVFPRLVELSRQLVEAIKNSKDDPAIMEMFREFLRKKGITDTDGAGEDIFGDTYAWASMLLLDWLIEPIFGRNGERIEGAELIEVKEAADGETPEFILRTPDGEIFSGEILDWEVYLVEPNTGIGQIDRRYLELWKLEARRAANATDPEERHINWELIERDDITVMSNWIDRGEGGMEINFGGNAFTPSPDPVFPESTIGVDDIRRAYGLSPVDVALRDARAGLDMADSEAFDEISLSVLIKYYMAARISEEHPDFNIEETRKRRLRAGEGARVDTRLDITLALLIKNRQALTEALGPLCGSELNIDIERLNAILEDADYMQEIGGLVQAYLLTDWHDREVEVMPSKLTPTEFMQHMPGKKRLLAHISSFGSPVAANDTFALMQEADSSGTDIGVIGTDAFDLGQMSDGNWMLGALGARPLDLVSEARPVTRKALALLQFSNGARKRLVRVSLEKTLPFNAIWRDETCPPIRTDLPIINPTDVSLLCDSKAATIEALKRAGIGVPESLLFSGRLAPRAWARDQAMRKFLQEQLDVEAGQPYKVFVSPDIGTHGVGTIAVEISREGFSDDVKQVSAHIASTGGIITAASSPEQIGWPARNTILRRDSGNVNYQDGDDIRKIDFRYNVAYTGDENYAVVSEFATVASDESPDVVSVGRGARIVNPIDAYRNLVVELPDGRNVNLELGNVELGAIRAMVSNALKALNEGRPDNEKLLFAGVDVRLRAIVTHLDGEKYRISLQAEPVVVLEVNSKAAGLCRSYRPLQQADDEVTVPQVAGQLWDYLDTTVKAAGAGLPEFHGILGIGADDAREIDFSGRVIQLKEAFMGTDKRYIREPGMGVMDWVYHESFWDEGAATERLPHEIVPAHNPLTATVTEHSDDLTEIRRLNLGTFFLSRKLNSAEPDKGLEMLAPMWTELKNISQGMQEYDEGDENGHEHDIAYLIWPGMGGSAEDKYLCEATGVYEGRKVRVFVLDDTDRSSLGGIIEEIRAAEKAKAQGEGAELTDTQALERGLKQTLVMIQALGKTPYEPVINAKFGLHPIFSSFKLDGRKHFRGMTIDGSHLDNFMQDPFATGQPDPDRAYLRWAHQPDSAATLSGRHDGPLSYGNLFPLMLNNINIEKWAAQTNLSPKEIEAAMELAAWITANVERGQNMVTLFLPEEWRGAGLWIKQLFEESLGKVRSFGLKIVINEALTPEAITNIYERTHDEGRDDRCYLAVNIKGLTNADPELLAGLEKMDCNVHIIEFNDEEALKDRVLQAKLMQFFHHSVLPVAYSFGLCAVDQPPVETYKSMVEVFEEQGLANVAQWQMFNFQQGGSTYRRRRLYEQDGIGLNIWPMLSSVLSKGDGRIGAINYTLLVRRLKSFALLIPEGVDHRDPAVVWAALNMIAEGMEDEFGQPAMRYGSLVQYADSSRTPDGRALREVLDREGAKFYQETALVPADTGKGPGHNHSIHAMDKGWRHSFMTAIMPTERPPLHGAPTYPDEYLTEQWFATMLALCGYEVSADGQSLEWNRNGAPGFVVALTFDRPDETGREALADFFKRATHVYREALLGQRMQETIDAMQDPDFVPSEHEAAWDIYDLNTQRRFVHQIISQVSNETLGIAVGQVVILNYLRWIMGNVIVHVQNMDSNGGPDNRLFANELFAHMTSLLGIRQYRRAHAMFKRVVWTRFYEILPMIADHNLYLYHGFITDMAEGSTAALFSGIEALKVHARQLLATGEPIMMVRAEIAYAIISDIYGRYLSDPDNALEWAKKIKIVDGLLYDVYRKLVLEDTPVGRRALSEGAANQAFFSVVPGRLAWSSEFGSDALHCVLLSKASRVISAPVRFADESWQEKTAPLIIAHRINPERVRKTEGGKKWERTGARVVVRAVSNMDPKNQVIDAEISEMRGNVARLYCLGQGSQEVFTATSKEEPLSFPIHALWATGIIGAGLDSLPNTTSDEKAKARTSIRELAQLYLRKRPEQALYDIHAFTRGGGLALTCDSHKAPVAAGLSSSSSVAVGLFSTLFSISGREEAAKDEVACGRLALIFENDKGRGTGAQDTTGSRKGLKEIVYLPEGRGVGEHIHYLEPPKGIVESIMGRTIIFRPGIQRAASQTIGEKQFEFLLRSPDKWRAICNGRPLHDEISAAVKSGNVDALGRGGWAYTEERSKIHESALPREMVELYKELHDPKEGEPLITGMILAGAMGRGASAILFESDYGYEKIDYDGERISRLEKKLREIIAVNMVFSDGEIIFVDESKEGRQSGTMGFHPFNDIVVKSDSEKMARHAANDFFEAFQAALERNQSQGRDYVVASFDADLSHVDFFDALVERFKRADEEHQAGPGAQEHYYSSRLRGVHSYEYADLPKDSPISCKSFLLDHLVRRLGIDEGNFLFMADYADYEAKARELGKVDISCIGIAGDGRMSYNDTPADFIAGGIVRARLTESDRLNLIYDFPETYNPEGLSLDNPEERQQLLSQEGLPRFVQVKTVSSIVKTDKIMVIMPGPERAHAAANIITGELNPAVPGTFLRTHEVEKKDPQANETVVIGDVTFYLERGMRVGAEFDNLPPSAYAHGSAALLTAEIISEATSPMVLVDSPPRWVEIVEEAAVVDGEALPPAFDDGLTKDDTTQHYTGGIPPHMSVKGVLAGELSQAQIEAIHKFLVDNGIGREKLNIGALSLDLSDKQVSGINALKGMPLEQICFTNTAVTDEQIEEVFGAPADSGGLTIINQAGESNTYEISSSETGPSTASSVSSSHAQKSPKPALAGLLDTTFEDIDTLTRANLLLSIARTEMTEPEYDVLNHALKAGDTIILILAGEEARGLKPGPISRLLPPSAAIGALARAAASGPARPKGTIAINDASLSAEVRALYSEGSEAVKQLEIVLGANVRLLSQLSETEKTGDLVIISDEEVSGYDRDAERLGYLMVPDMGAKNLLIAPLVCTARVLLSNIISNVDEKLILEALNSGNFYQELFGSPATEEVVARFVETGLFELPIPRYDYEATEQAERLSLAAAIAA